MPTDDRSGLRVRPACREDLPRLLALLQQLSLGGGQPESGVREADERLDEALEELLDDPRFDLLVLESAGEVLGACTLYALPNLSHGGARLGLVENVVVDQAARSRGYGELLMAEATRLAREAGCYKVALASNAGRIAAHRFYERIGFMNSHKGFTVYFP